MLLNKLWNFEKNIYILDGGMGTLIKELGYDIDVRYVNLFQKGLDSSFMEWWC